MPMLSSVSSVLSRLRHGFMPPNMCHLEAVTVFDQGMSANEIASELGIHRSTVYRNFKEAA